MVSDHSAKSGSQGYGDMKIVAWSILVMGLSLAGVIILWMWFGYIGPSFSEDVLSEQQKMLREQYGLPPVEDIEDKEILETPPSLRDPVK